MVDMTPVELDEALRRGGMTATPVDDTLTVWRVQRVDGAGVPGVRYGTAEDMHTLYAPAGEVLLRRAARDGSLSDGAFVALSQALRAKAGA